jgi:peptidoglycan/xylan/chitin deacetylase (PgdA/CDA1 family)
MNKPVAHVSVDLDPIDTHLAGYGLAAPRCDRIYEASVPRILHLLDHLGLRATLFVIARDAERQARWWRDAAGRGHEIASHSLTHPIPFASLPAAVKTRELIESRARLEDAVGRPVLGFRAPGWDVDRPTLDTVAAAGYRYDASILPSPAVLPGALLRFLLSAGRMRELSLARAARLAFTPRRPYRLANGLWEFPVAVSPVLRLPFTHTLRYLAPAGVCRRTWRAIVRSQTPLMYQFHAVDLLDLDRDGIDPRMARHPGMTLPLERKHALLEDALRAIQASYRVRTYAEAVLSGAAGSALAPDRSLEPACGSEAV